MLRPVTRLAVNLVLLSVLLAIGLGGCAIVPRYQREAMAHPAMDPMGTALQDRSENKLHAARELAAGGNGRPAGGGCGCSN